MRGCASADFTQCLLFGHEQQSHSPMRHSRLPLDLRQVLERLGNLAENLVTVIPMQHLAAAEEHGELYLVALFQEFSCMLELDIQIAFVSFRPEPNFLQRGGVMYMLLVRLASLALLLIQPLSIIHYSANGRVARRGDLHQVQLSLTSSG
jgi:hypothetical protein